MANAIKFSIQLKGVSYNMAYHWNTPSNCWLMDIADANGNLLVGSVPLVTGADLLGQFSYLNIGGALLAQTSNDANAVPTYANFGLEGNLFFIPLAAPT